MSKLEWLGAAMVAAPILIMFTRDIIDDPIAFFVVFGLLAWFVLAVLLMGGYFS